MWQVSSIGLKNDTLVIFLCLGNGDFTLVSATVTFLSNNTIDGDTKCIEINIVDDDIYEEDEVFLLNITNVMPSSTAVIGAMQQVAKTIQDNMGRTTL